MEDKRMDAAYCHCTYVRATKAALITLTLPGPAFLSAQVRTGANLFPFKSIAWQSATPRRIKDVAFIDGVSKVPVLREKRARRKVGSAHE